MTWVAVVSSNEKNPIRWYSPGSIDGRAPTTSFVFGFLSRPRDKGPLGLALPRIDKGPLSSATLETRRSLGAIIGAHSRRGSHSNGRAPLVTVANLDSKMLSILRHRTSFWLFVPFGMRNK